MPEATRARSGRRPAAGRRGARRPRPRPRPDAVGLARRRLGGGGRRLRLPRRRLAGAQRGPALGRATPGLRHCGDRADPLVERFGRPLPPGRRRRPGPADLRPDRGDLHPSTAARPSRRGARARPARALPAAAAGCRQPRRREAGTDPLGGAGSRGAAREPGARSPDRRVPHGDRSRDRPARHLGRHGPRARFLGGRGAGARGACALDGLEAGAPAGGWGRATTDGAGTRTWSRGRTFPRTCARSIASSCAPGPPCSRPRASWYAALRPRLADARHRGVRGAGKTPLAQMEDLRFRSAGTGAPPPTRGVRISEPLPPPPPVVGRSDVFISYAREDAAFVRDRLVPELERRGKVPWVDLEAIPPGADWRDRIEAGLRAANAVVCVQPASLADLPLRGRAATRPASAAAGGGADVDSAGRLPRSSDPTGCSCAPGTTTLRG